jgi:uncharacterized repeat protein (TIGR01451 family)
MGLSLFWVDARFPRPFPREEPIMLSRLVVSGHSPGVRHRRAAITLTWGLLLLALALFWLLTGPAEAVCAADDPPKTAQVWTVCPAGPPDCAYSIIQDAVDAASEGDVIKVATGLYTDVHGRAAPSGYDGPSVITQVVYISKTVTVQGGYTTTNWITPDLEANPTTLDAQGQGRVLFITGQISPTIEGLRLTGGDATGLGSGWGSGGDGGGGVYVVDATATISRNQVFSNTAVHLGGGLYLDHSPATLSRNDIIANSAGGGGGLFLGGSPAALSGNTIVANTANNDSGGLFLEFSDARLTNNIIADNEGGLYVSWSSPRLWHTTFARNGTGIYVYNEFLSPTVLTNTIMVSHTVGVYVDVMYEWQSGVRMKATLWGDGAWANETDLFCLLGECSIGAVNVWGEPDFVDPDSGDYHIALGSAALDAGLDAGIASDIDGEPRPAALGFDIGADELSGTIPLLHKAAWPPAINPGRMVTYTLSITSAGTYTATSVWFTDTLPALQRPVGITVTQGSCAAGADWGSSATCDLGTMPPGARAIVTLTAQVTTTLPARPLRVMRNVAWITSAETTNRMAFADTTMQDCHVRLNDDPVEYATVQAAVDASNQPADVVRVAGYCTGAVSQAGIDQVAYLDKALTLQGGWNISFTQRNVISYPTTLDALGQGRVLYITGEVSPTVEGLQITGGDAYGLGGGPWACGPCQGAGGGIYVATAQATIGDSQVFSNTGFFGGGLFLTDSPAMLSGTTIASNTAGRDASDNGCGCLGYGGGLYLESSPAVLSGSTVISNTGRYGGGLYLEGSSAILRENTVTRNTGYNGGGLHLEGSPALLRDNTVIDNTGYLGAGLFLSDGSDALLIDNVIADNQGDSYFSSGNGLFVEDCSPRLSYTTIARNAGGYGSGIYLSGGSVALTNTILVSQTVGIRVPGGDTAYLESTLWNGNGDNWLGAIYHDNDYTGAPAFVDPDAGDYHIGLGSAARDRGVDAGVYADMDGEPRPAGLGYDLGADEFHGAGVAVTKQAHVDPVVAGGPVTYTLCVTNAGTVSLTATITDVLPGQVTPSGVLTWTPPSLLPGDTWTETAAVTVQVGYAGLLTNVVRVSTEEGATGVYTSTIRAEEAIAGLEAANDSPTLLDRPTALTATVTAGSHVTYTWAFGDGEVGSGAVVSHTYPAPGVYTAVVTAGNSVSELTATTGVTITPRSCWVRLNDSPTDYASVQAAVDASTEPGDVVKVAGYCVGLDTRPAPPGYPYPPASGLLTQTVYLSKTLTIQGGYTTTDWINPDPEANPTTLDAQWQGRVLFVTGSISPTIEGLRITGGDAFGLGGTDEYDAGGGVYVKAATATVSNCQIYSNTASTAARGFGGGLALYDWHDATLSGNTIWGNTAGGGGPGWGGGLFLSGGDGATLSNNTVRENTASTADWGWGGGLAISASAITLSGNTIVSNTASSAGDGGAGGLFLGESDAALIGNIVRGNTASTAGWGVCGGLYVHYSAARVNGNTFLNNIASTAARGEGGGLCLWVSEASLRGNRIISNTATLSLTASGYGGGLYVGSGHVYTLTNNLVVDNQANTEGSGLWFAGSSDHPSLGRLLHTTIADNHSSGQGLYVGDYASLAFTNTIIAGHQGVGITVTTGSTATLEATLWHNNGSDTGGEGTIVTGTVNVWGEPAFVDPSAGDYHISPGSAALDRGVDAGITVDMDGDPRPVGAGFDIGADERPIGLAVSKEASSDPVQAGTSLTYTLQVINNGIVSLTAAITDVLPGQVTPSGVLTWTPPSILPGDAWTETVAVTVEVGYAGPLTNVVRVSTQEGAAGAYTSTVIAQEAIAGLEASNDSPTVLGEPTALTATVTAGSHVSYTWAFGDGEAGSGVAVSHTYPAPGVYTAVVTASNPVSILTATTPVTVAEPIDGLVVVNDSPTVLGATTTFTATVIAGSDVTYTWDLGDGTVGQYVGAVHGEEASRQEEASEPFVLTHVYPAVGVYTAIFTASNALGELTATTVVTVDEAIAGLEALNDSPTVLGEPTALTATVTAGSNVTYTWAFGDGEVGSGVVVTHTYTDVGIYSAVITASNSVGLLTATTTVEIAAPTIYIYLPLVLRE